MKKHILLLLLISLPAMLYAQKQGQESIDSLQREVSVAKEDTAKVKLLAALSSAYRLVDPGIGVKYGQQCLDLARSLNWDLGIAHANNALGLNYENMSDFPTSLEYYLKALKLYESAGYKPGLAQVQANMAIVYNDQDNNTKALEYCLKALKINEELGDKGNTATTLGYIGILYGSQKEYQQALQYFLRSLRMQEGIGDKIGLARNMGNIGIVYRYLGNYSLAMDYEVKALDISQQIGNKRSAAINLGNIGEVYLAMAKDTLHKITGPERNNDLHNAAHYFDSAINMCRSINYMDALSEYYLHLSETQKLLGDFSAALISHEKYTEVKDSVFSIQKGIKVAKLETQRALELKDKQLQIESLKLSKKRNAQFFYIAGLVLLLLLCVFIFRSYRLQRKTNVLLAKEKQRSEDLLLNILPAEVAEELKNKGSAEAKQFEHVTVLFTDFVGFTLAGEILSPTELVEELHTCFKAFDEIVNKYNIEKIKTIGDAYLAVSGLPIPNAKHAEHVVSAAIEIRDYMLQRRQQLGSKTFAIRIGIHSGNVVAGIVGLKKFSYDIWGDTVNTAARMEQHSSSGQVNISQTTYDLVKDKFVCTYRGEILAKNKGELKMYYVEKAG